MFEMNTILLVPKLLKANFTFLISNGLKKIYVVNFFLDFCFEYLLNIYFPLVNDQSIP